jgi:hypothetical protein
LGNEQRIPDDVSKLLIEHLNSLEKLLIFLLIHGHPKQVWTVATVALKLHLYRSAANEALAELCRSGMLEFRNGSAVSFGLGYVARAKPKVIEHLAKLYAENQVSILNFLSEKAFARVRSAVAEASVAGFAKKQNKETDD